MFDFFLSLCVILNAALLRTHLLRRMIQDLTFIFSKGVLNLFYHFFVFTFFIKIITTSSKGRETTRSPKPAVLNLIYSQWIYLHKWLRLASTGLASTQRCNACALLGVIRCFFGHGLGLCPKNPHASKWVALATNKSVCFFSNDVWFFLKGRPHGFAQG